jgi:hypothetical protein
VTRFSGQGVQGVQEGSGGFRALCSVLSERTVLVQGIQGEGEKKKKRACRGGGRLKEKGKEREINRRKKRGINRF